MEPDTKNKPQVLRAQDIIPSCGLKSDSLGADAARIMETAVPQFDLATEIMAQQRRQTASRRKKADNRAQAAREEIKVKLPDITAMTVAFDMPVHNVIIAEIVSRDIQRMLRTSDMPQA